MFKCVWPFTSFVSEKKAAIVFKTRLSLKEKKKAKGFLTHGRRENVAGGMGERCKSRNLNKTNIFNHEVGEMHTL